MVSGGGSIVRANCFVAVWAALSRTCTVKFAVPGVVVIPLMTPVVGDNVNPAGSAPEVTDHINEGTPPLADKVWEYAVPTVPFGRGDDVEIEIGGGIIVRANCFVAVLDALSAT